MEMMQRPNSFLFETLAPMIVPPQEADDSVLVLSAGVQVAVRGNIGYAFRIDVDPGSHHGLMYKKDAEILGKALLELAEHMTNR